MALGHSPPETGQQVNVAFIACPLTERTYASTLQPEVVKRVTIPVKPLTYFHGEPRVDIFSRGTKSGMK